MAYFANIVQTLCKQANRTDDNKKESSYEDLRKQSGF